MSFRRCTSRSSTASRRSSTLVLALTLGAGLVAATPGAAQARTVTDADDVKDMAKLVPGTEEFEPAPRHRLNDVKSTDLVHTSDKVGARLTLAQLSKTDVLSWQVEIISSKGEKRQATLTAGEGNWSGVLAVYDPETEESVECGGHDIDYADDVVRITLPKDCVGAGRWMQFRVGAAHVAEDAIFIDDAVRDRPVKSSDNGLALSRRVYR